MEQKYFEDRSFDLPNISNGVCKLGDLWDCRTSTSLSLNLFGKDLDEKYLSVSEIASGEYQLIHIKSTEDKLKSLHVDGEISLELMGGLISIKGSASFNDKQVLNKHFEKLTVRNKQDKYSVDLLPSAKEVIDDLVKDKLMTNQINATHVVKKVLIGADIDASITISTKTVEKKQDIQGSLFGKLVYGPVNASVKASLQMLDENNCSDIETSINIESKPPVGNPKTIDEMFRIVENIQPLIEKHNSFKQLTNYQVIGVPIRYYLVPINHFLDVHIEKLYVKLKDEVIVRFSKMLAKIRDYADSNCIRNRVFDRYPRSGLIIFKKESKISQDIDEYEKIIIPIANEFFPKARDCFRNYKVGKCDEKQLLQLISEFDEKFKLTEIENKISNFEKECRAELNYVRFEDSLSYEKDFTLFVDHLSMEEWFNPDKNPIILLKTKYRVSPDKHRNVFLNLYKCSTELKKMGFGIGVAVPSVSKELSLTIKVNGDAKVYYDDDIIFALRMIMIRLGYACANEIIFTTIYAEQKEIDLCLDQNNLHQINKFIELLKESRNIKIAETSSDTNCLLRAHDDKWRFFLTLDCIESAPGAVNRLKLLMRSELSKLNNGNIEWLVGNLDIKFCNHGPYIMVIQNGHIHYVLTDYLDILIMIEHLKSDLNESMSNLNDLKMLKIDTLNSAFNREKVEYALKVNKMLNDNDELHLSIEIPDFLLQLKKNDNLIELMEILRSIAKRESKMDLFTKIASICYKYDSDLETNLKEQGINKNSLKSSNNSQWDSIVNIIRQYPISKKQVYVNVKNTYDLIEVAIKNNFKKDDKDNAFSAIENLVKSEQTPAELRNEFIKCSTMSDDNKQNEFLKSISSDFRKYLSKNKYREVNSIHLDSLIEVGKMTDVERDMQSQYQEIIQAYLTRLFEQKIFDEKTAKELGEYIERKHFYRLLNTLSKYPHKENLNESFEHFKQSLDEKNSVKQLIEKLSNYSNQVQQYLWNNQRFLYVVDKNLNDDLVQLIEASNFERHILPAHIVQRMKKQTQSNKNSSLAFEKLLRIHGEYAKYKIQCVENNFYLDGGPCHLWNKSFEMNPNKNYVLWSIVKYKDYYRFECAANSKYLCGGKTHVSESTDDIDWNVVDCQDGYYLQCKTNCVYLYGDSTHIVEPSICESKRGYLTWRITNSIEPEIKTTPVIEKLITTYGKYAKYKIQCVKNNYYLDGGPCHLWNKSFEMNPNKNYVLWSIVKYKDYYRFECAANSKYLSGGKTHVSESTDNIDWNVVDCQDGYYLQCKSNCFYLYGDSTHIVEPSICETNRSYITWKITNVIKSNMKSALTFEKLITTYGKHEQYKIQCIENNFYLDGGSCHLWKHLIEKHPNKNCLSWSIIKYDKFYRFECAANSKYLSGGKTHVSESTDHIDWNVFDCQDGYYLQCKSNCFYLYGDTTHIVEPSICESNRGYITWRITNNIKPKVKSSAGFEKLITTYGQYALYKIQCVKNNYYLDGGPCHLWKKGFQNNPNKNYLSWSIIKYDDHYRFECAANSKYLCGGKTHVSESTDDIDWNVVDCEDGYYLQCESNCVYLYGDSTHIVEPSKRESKRGYITWRIMNVVKSNMKSTTAFETFIKTNGENAKYKIQCVKNNYYLDGGPCHLWKKSFEMNPNKDYVLWSIVKYKDYYRFECAANSKYLCGGKTHVSESTDDIDWNVVDCQDGYYLQCESNWSYLYGDSNHMVDLSIRESKHAYITWKITCIS